MNVYEKYVKIIDFWKENPPVIEGSTWAGFARHHPVPEAFQKIKDEHKHELTFELMKRYHDNEIVMMPERVHFELHMLLVEMYPERSQEWFKMSHALAWFLGKRQNRFDITPEEYEQARITKSCAQRLMPITDERRTKQSKISTEMWTRPEFRKKRAITDAKPEVKARRSNAIKGMFLGTHLKPDVLERVRERNKDPISRQRKSEGIKKSWECKETRESRLRNVAHPINVYDLSWKFIRTYETIAECCKDFHIKKFELYLIMRHDDHPQFIFRYVDDANQPSEYIRLLSRKKMTIRKVVQSEETKIKRANSIRGKKRSNKTKQRISRSLIGKSKGRKLSEETKQKMSIARKGKSKGKGRKLSIEHKKKLSIANKGKSRSKGKRHSEETKKKMSASRKGKEIVKLQGKSSWNKGLKGQVAWNKGRKLSEEEKFKQNKMRKLRNAAKRLAKLILIDDAKISIDK